MNPPGDSRRELEALLRRASRLGMLVRGSQLPSVPIRADAPPAGEPLALAAACPGVELLAGGPCWLIERSLRQVSPQQAALAGQYAAVLRGARQRFDELSASSDLCRVADGRPEDLLFLDIESCGLAAAPVFLLGLMNYADGDLVFRQYLARDYSEEPAVLAAAADRLAGGGLLVSFNGKAFDLNLLRERAAFHGLALPEELPPHLDLLHEARRRWRRRLPNCKLQTLERLLCGRLRVGDIPGAAIAEAYHRYVQTGDARRIADIVHHNLMDLLTMAELVCLLLTGCEAPEQT